MKRTSNADLPLHGGHVPPWLARQMEKLVQFIENKHQPSVEPQAVIDWEKRNAWKYSGKTVFGDVSPPKKWHLFI